MGNAMNERTIYVENEQHYEQVIERITTVKKFLWIGACHKNCVNDIS